MPDHGEGRGFTAPNEGVVIFLMVDVRNRGFLEIYTKEIYSKVYKEIRNNPLVRLVIDGLTEADDVLSGLDQG